MGDSLSHLIVSCQSGALSKPRVEILHTILPLELVIFCSYFFYCLAIPPRMGYRAFFFFFFFFFSAYSKSES